MRNFITVVALVYGMPPLANWYSNDLAQFQFAGILTTPRSVYGVSILILNLTKQGNSRRDWLWEFERYCWESKELISSCKVSNEGYFWSVYAEFPKKYKGAIARLYVGCEEGGENVFILC